MKHVWCYDHERWERLTYWEIEREAEREMPVLSIRIVRKNDIAEGDPPVFPTGVVSLERGEIAQIVGLEKGMTSGRPSVAIIIRLDSGSVVFAETSYLLFKTAARALEAAKLAGVDT